MPALAMLCATVTIGLMFAIPTAAERHGADVLGRFLEKGRHYDAESLRAWVTTHAESARGYAFPVLFPLDALFLCALGAFACVASIGLAHMTGLLPGRSWLLVVIPLTYAVTDLVEDTALAAMLTDPARINDALVAATRAITRIKLVTAMLSLAQVFVLSALAAYRQL
jgi:hypothetical protein